MTISILESLRTLRDSCEAKAVEFENDHLEQIESRDYRDSTVTLNRLVGNHDSLELLNRVISLFVYSPMGDAYTRIRAEKFVSNFCLKLMKDPSYPQESLRMAAVTAQQVSDLLVDDHLMVTLDTEIQTDK